MTEVDIKFEFLEEAIELAENCEGAFALLKDDPNDGEAIDNLFRNLHTIKGSSGVVGFEELSKFVHKIEDGINLFRDDHYFPPEKYDLFISCNDLLTNWLEGLKSDSQYAPDYSNHEEQLLEFIGIDAPVKETPQESFGVFEDSNDKDSKNMDDSKICGVLIVDDEPGILENIEFYLEELDVKTYTADSGISGLKIFEKQDIDVIITDLTMPEMNGIEFIKRVRKIAPKVEVIFLSGNANRESLEEFIKLNTFAFLDKSSEPVRIINTVRSALRSKRVNDAVSLLTKLNMEIFIDFRLLHSCRSEKRQQIEARIDKKLTRVSELSSIIGDTELLLHSNLKKIA